MIWKLVVTLVIIMVSGEVKRLEPETFPIRFTDEASCIYFMRENPEDSVSDFAETLLEKALETYSDDDIDAEFVCQKQ